MFHFFSNLFYRCVAPDHPRGWLDVHAVRGEAGPEPLLWIHSHGMERFDRPDVEIIDVPLDLGGHVHAILFDVVDALKNGGPLASGEELRGPFVSQDQRGIHVMTLHTIRRPDDPEHDGFQRIVDRGEAPESGFPKRLLATHLCSLADTKGSPGDREVRYSRAIELFPGEPAPRDTSTSFEPGTNPGNFLSWYGRAEALCDLDEVDEGLRCLRQAIIRCPAWARKFSQHIRDNAPKRGGEDEPLSKFWIENDIDELVGE